MQAAPDQVRVRPAKSDKGPAYFLRIAVYVMLVVSAGAVFLGGDELWAAARAGTLPVWAALLPVCAFTVFVLVFSVDRLLLVKRRRYAAGRAFFQIAFALLFVGLLWPQQANQMQSTQESPLSLDPDERLLRHEDAAVRAAVCELLGLRTQVSALALVDRLASQDPALDVRRACAAAANRLRSAGAGSP